ncbi:MAG TPA: PAS domain S-box protein [Steroidobacteraceae bacterium]|nr:PAS domain S-box protein [Steroidobacteraceae bacterium]
MEGFFERVHTDDVARVRQAVATATASGGPFDIEFRIVRPDGEIRWISSRGGVVRGLDGCVQRVTGINADITSRYRLSEESRYLAAVMDAMAEGVNVVGVDGLIRYSNRRFEQLFGYAPGELNGQSVSVLNAGSPSEQRETVRSIIEHLNRDGVWRGEVQNRRKDGTEFWSQATINTMRHPVFGEVWASIQADITKRKRIEGELRFVGDAMASMAEGVMVAGTDSVIRYTNARFDELFGYEPGELLGQHTSVLNYGNHSEQLETSGIIDLAVEKNGVWRGEIRNQRKDGREFWTRATVSVLNHPQFGECWVTVQADITELKRLQVDRAAAMTSLQRLRDNMEDEAERLQRELALEIHDEIGAKLTAIGMRLDAAQSAIGHGQPVRGEDLDALRLLVARAAASTRELCARLRPAMLDDLGLVETCRWYLRDWSRNTGIEAEARLQDLPVPLPERLVTDLFRVFQELLTNVARHSGARHVVASCGYESGKVRLVVRDDGHGLSPKRSGGFGLAGIRERLRRHDGSFDIRADSPGTVATVEVPMVAPRGTAARRVGRRA